MPRKTLHKCIMYHVYSMAIVDSSVLAKNELKNSDVKNFKRPKISDFGKKKCEKSKNQISKLSKVQKNNKELDDSEPRIN